MPLLMLNTITTGSSKPWAGLWVSNIRAVPESSVSCRICHTDAMAGSDQFALHAPVVVYLSLQQSHPDVGELGNPEQSTSNVAWWQGAFTLGSGGLWRGPRTRPAAPRQKDWPVYRSART
jgi:hypothetical protein